MWLRKQNPELSDAWLRHSPSMMLASGPDGQIYWANDAFCDWSRYTLAELQAIGWRKISVADETLKSDISSMMAVLDGYRQVCTCQTQYIPKNDRPQWGDLTVIRYPAVGPVTCFLCTFEPLRNGTAAAFSLAVDHIKECRGEMNNLTAEVRRLSTVDEDEDFVIKIVRAARRHPRIAGLVLATVLAAPSLNQLRELTLWALGIKPQAELVTAPEGK